MFEGYVPLYKARGGPHVCMYVCISVQPTNGMAANGYRTRATLANKWIARTPRVSAHSDHKHSKDLHARPDQLHPDPRAAQREAVEMIASLTVSRIGINRGASGRPRVSASSAARGRRNERVTYSPPSWCNQRIFRTAQSFGERRSARASSHRLLGGKVRGRGPPPPRPPGGGVGGSGGEGRPSLSI